MLIDTIETKSQKLSVTSQTGTPTYRLVCSSMQYQNIVGSTATLVIAIKYTTNIKRYPEDGSKSNCRNHIYIKYTVEKHAVAQLVEAPRYKPEGRGFDSRWCHWNFSLTYSFRPHYGPQVDSASNRNEYQHYFLGVKAAGA